MSYTIITDACSDLLPEMVKEMDVVVIPMEFEIGGKTYLHYPDWRSMQSKRFFDLMRQKNVAKTFQVTPETYLKTFEEEYAKSKEMLVVAFSSALSGTCNNAVLARNQFVETHPDAKIEVVDSLSACGGQGLLVAYVAHNRNVLNMSMEDNLKWLKENTLHLCHRFTVDDLGTLRRGGRLSATSAFLGAMIGIKPVLHVDNEGKLVPTDKVRGRMKSLRTLVDHMKETIINPEDQIIYIHHADDIEAANKVAEMIRSEVQVKEIKILPFGPIIGAHTGPGAIALFFMGTER
ncbi:MAG TPA: fatty acid-binding protein DegV [Firmicutes bacterium]|nr:fatty acid-binding protein DegV [Bacillota bacterium]